MSRLSKLPGNRLLCYVTDRHLLAEEKSVDKHEVLLRKIEKAAVAGVDWIQIREKDYSGKDCSHLTRKALRRAAKPRGSEAGPTQIIVNDRLDVGLAEHADGVHLGEASLPVAEARRLAAGRDRSADFLVGVSCHSLEEARSAEANGAHYLFFGPVFTTPSKASFGPAQGLERLAEVCRAVSLPVLAIGGVTLENFASCLEAGAAGIAAIRLFQDAQDLASLVKTLRTQKDWSLSH